MMSGVYRILGLNNPPLDKVYIKRVLHIYIVLYIDIILRAFKKKFNTIISVL